LLKILVAPASYKGSIAAHRLAAAMARGCKDLAGADAANKDIHRLYRQMEILAVPIADGGDDTLASINLALGGVLVESQVIGPTGQTVQASYLRLPETALETTPGLAPDLAIIELAQASGIAYLTSDQLAPLAAHTYGTGQLIGSAIAGGAKEIVITVGGSASTDGGTGALSALGARFLDMQGQPVPRGGGGLRQIARIDLSELIQATAGVSFIVATDVTSPLLGAAGAAAVFGPQKGANPADVALLEEGLAHFASLLEKQLDPGRIAALRHVPGAGAAGGAGFGFAAILGAQIVSGFHFLAELLGLEQKIRWCDLIIVGEGKLDGQSLSGKGVGEIISLAAQLGKTVLALPARSELSAAELAILVRAPDPSKIIVSATAQSGMGMATEADVQAATTMALAQLDFVD
jgi:glycerate 2-kinase